MDFKHRNYIIISAAIILALIVSGTLFFYFENTGGNQNVNSIGDAFWYLIVTITSVGYGDITPVTQGGRVIGTILVLSSMVILGVLISSITSNIIRMIEEKKLGYRGTNFNNHIICIGWNEFSKMVIFEVLAANRKVAIITDNKKDIEFIYSEFGNENIYVLYSELHNLESINRANPEKASDVFLSFHDDTESLIYVINFRNQYPQPNIVVTISNHKLKETFYTAGVRHVVARNEIASKLVASYVFEPDVAELNIDLLSSASDDEDFDNQQYIVTEKNPYLNKNYDDAYVALKIKYNIVLLGIVKRIEGKPQLHINARSDTIIELNDYLIIMVGGKMKARVEKIFGVHEGKINHQLTAP
ncbi:MAG: NAD-binding protein [Bacteroidales bacterium]|nr:NAD-binding protein [Bacteroidales bacterium]